MRTVIMVGGFLGILLSVAAILFAVVDDSYGFGNFGLLAIIGGILGVIGAFRVRKSVQSAALFIVAGCILGIYGLWTLFLIPAGLMLVPFMFIVISNAKTLKT